MAWSSPQLCVSRGVPCSELLVATGFNSGAEDTLQRQFQRLCSAKPPLPALAAQNISKSCVSLCLKSQISPFSSDSAHSVRSRTLKSRSHSVPSAQDAQPWLGITRTFQGPRIQGECFYGHLKGKKKSFQSRTKLFLKFVRPSYN